MFHAKHSKSVPLPPCRRQKREEYTFYSFLTSALDGDLWSVPRPGCVLSPGKGPPVPVGHKAGWVSELVWTQTPEGKSFASQGSKCTKQMHADLRVFLQPGYRHKCSIKCLFQTQTCNCARWTERQWAVKLN
jgi:hypothetical protein